MKITKAWEHFWFGSIPAYRLATFRTAIAVTTIIWHIPALEGAVHRYLLSSFHFPMVLWIPSLTAEVGRALIILTYLASGCLLLGFFSRLSALFLALSGLYVFLLDVQHYSHGAQFHLILLFLLACSGDRLSLLDLVREDGGQATCEAWPERLIRLQLSIVLFYAALDKVLSPFWGLSGEFFIDQFISRLGQGMIQILPAVMSVGVIGIEFLLATGLLLRPLWPIAVPTAVVFFALLEISIGPGSFAWELLAALILFLPAADRRFVISYDPTSRLSRWKRRLISRLDWLRRIRWSAWQLSQ